MEHIKIMLKNKETEDEFEITTPLLGKILFDCFVAEDLAELFKETLDKFYESEFSYSLINQQWNKK